MENHWKWLQNDEKHYEFYVTDEKGRRKVFDRKAGLAESLQVADWDVISLQDGSSGHLETVEDLTEHAAPYAALLYPYLRKQFPNARYLWHHTWVYEVGFTCEKQPMRNVPNRENQEWRHQLYKAVSKHISKENGVDIVPSGVAWQKARQHELIGDTLCGRIKTGDLVHGDYYHDGDVGGGQYLNACVWFETLTGKSCIGNEYRPDYELSEEKISVLQEAAHGVEME
jgi:hypothetical protein